MTKPDTHRWFRASSLIVEVTLACIFAPFGSEPRANRCESKVEENGVGHTITPTSDPRLRHMTSRSGVWQEGLVSNRAMKILRRITTLRYALQTKSPEFGQSNPFSLIHGSSCSRIESSLVPELLGRWKAKSPSSRNITFTDRHIYALAESPMTGAEQAYLIPRHILRSTIFQSMASSCRR